MPVHRLTTRRNILFVDFFFQQPGLVLLLAEGLLFQFQFSLKSWEFAVSQFGDFIQVIGSFRPLDRLFDFLDVLANFSELADRVLLGFPTRLQSSEIAILLGQFFFDGLEARLAAGVRFFLERFPLDFQLQHFSGDFVELGRQTVNFGSEARGRPRRPDQSPCPAETGRRYTDSKVWLPPRGPRP